MRYILFLLLLTSRSFADKSLIVPIGHINSETGDLVYVATREAGNSVVLINLSGTIQLRREFPNVRGNNVSRAVINQKEIYVLTYGGDLIRMNTAGEVLEKKIGFIPGATEMWLIDKNYILVKTVTFGNKPGEHTVQMQTINVKSPFSFGNASKCDISTQVVIINGKTYLVSESGSVEFTPQGIQKP